MIKHNKVFLLMALILTGLMAGCPAFALEEGTEAEQLRSLSTFSVAGYVFRIIISLAFILAITYFVMRILKKQCSIQQRQKNWIRIFDYQGLAANRGIYLVEILGKVYVLGASEGQISILAEIDQDDEYWNDIKEDVINAQEELLPPTMKKWVADNLGLFRKYQKGNCFSSELDKQLDRSQRLYRHISQGGQGNEK